MKYQIFALFCAGALMLGCSDKDNHQSEASYEPIITASGLYYMHEANLSMKENNVSAEYIGGRGRFQFHNVITFTEMNLKDAIYSDKANLAPVSAHAVCDENHTSDMSINALVPDLYAPDYNSSDFPYVNINIFTTLLQFNTREELAERYPNSAAFSRDFNLMF